MPSFYIVVKGVTISFEQLLTLRLLQIVYTRMRWHANDCECCMMVHTEDGDYVVGPDGDFDFYLRGESDETPHS